MLKGEQKFRYAHDEEVVDGEEETGDVFRFPKYKSLFAAALSYLYCVVTFIMEWDERKALADKLLTSKSSAQMYAERLLVIWYDSVTIDGNLVWQNLLNDKNKPFFDVCDGIFVNYTWQLQTENLMYIWAYLCLEGEVMVTGNGWYNFPRCAQQQPQHVTNSEEPAPVDLISIEQI